MGQELHPVTPGVGGEEAADAGEPVVPLHRVSGPFEPSRQGFQGPHSLQPKCHMGLLGRHEVGHHPDMDFLGTDMEPAPAPRGRSADFRPLVQLKQFAEELARGVLTPFRRGHLYVIDL